MAAVNPMLRLAPGLICMAGGLLILMDGTLAVPRRGLLLPAMPAMPAIGGVAEVALGWILGRAAVQENKRNK